MLCCFSYIHRQAETTNSLTRARKLLSRRQHTHSHMHAHIYLTQTHTHKHDPLNGTSHLHSVPLPLCAFLYVFVCLCFCVCVCVLGEGSGFEVFLGLVCFSLMLTAGFMGSFSVSPRQHAPLTSTSARSVCSTFSVCVCVCPAPPPPSPSLCSLSAAGLWLAVVMPFHFSNGLKCDFFLQKLAVHHIIWCRSRL